MKRWDLAGASVAIAKEGRLVFAKGYGYADSNDTIRVQPFNLFRIASVSKLITATAIMNLEEEEQLHLDDRIFGEEGILNDSIYCYPADPRALNITVRHLLMHSGGWTRRWGDHMFIPHTIAKFMDVPVPPDTETIVRFALAKKLHFTPGTYRSYSNLGYSILGLVIEKVTGQSYMEYVLKNIMEPLGIYDMQLGRNLAEDKAPLEVRYYEPDGSELVKSVYNGEELVPRSYGGNDIEALGGAGSWIASAPDLLKFVLAIDGDPGRTDILDKERIEIMTNPSTGYAPVGWKATISNGTWWRTGSFAGTSAMVKHQNDGFTWVVLLNSSTWKASKFPGEIDRTMRKVFGSVKEWPDQDLFMYRIPDPLVPQGLEGI
ncbi:MAG: beta-lactamase family protein [Bacteroidales bacterium]|nr:MAG: beta-lactamase family protein [Bacteroidales bacterium]